MKITDIRNHIGSKLAKTQFGVLIIANSYICDCYEWYRSLIYESDYSLEEIRSILKDDDKKYRWDWLLARAKATRIHCNHKELCEMMEYLEDFIDSYDNKASDSPVSESNENTETIENTENTENTDNTDNTNNE